jgi:hypothetical protein
MIARFNLSFDEYKYRYAIARLIDEAGNINEFRARNKREARRKAFDFIGRQQALILTDDHATLGELARRETPMNIEVKRR